jgi:hypothetical protein
VNYTGGTGIITPGNLSVSPTGTVVVPVPSTRTYTLTVTNSINVSTTQQLTIDVVPNPVINGFSASASNVAPNTNVTLTVNYTGGTGIITPGNLSVSPTGTVVVAPASTRTYTLTVTNSLNVSTMQQLTIDVVSITPSLSVNPQSVNLGQAFQVFYLVPINTSVTVTLTSDWTGLVLVSGTDFNIVNTIEDTTSVPGARQVLLDYQLLINNLTAFASRYGWNFVWCNIRVQGQGVNLSTLLYIEGDP